MTAAPERRGQPGARARLRTFTLLAAALLTATLSPLARSAAAGSDPALTDSAVTKSGSGRFANLDVTVGKTKNLGNEAVRVSWQWTGTDPGSHATVASTSWDYNYVSVFQCWGDAAGGPDREQCQYGGQYSDTDIGSNRRLSPFNAVPEKGWALSRAVSPLNAFSRTIPQSKDPLEYSATNGYPATSSKAGIVAMHASPSKAFPDGEIVTDIDTARFFDLYGTNEVPLARTNSDGSGQVYFEMQTVFESQFLGCGARVGTGASVAGRGCYLVVVPRDAIDSNGEDVTTRAGGSERSLYSSPLSLSNWADRVSFPLAFEPVREPCALGGTERPLVGQESLSVAISSWQTPLCAGGQGYFYASTSDDIARSSAGSKLPKYSIVSDPLPPDAVSPDNGSLVYAPTAASGVSVSFFIERYYAGFVPAEYQKYNGTRVEQLRLSPRLVAKLLTQSYKYSTVTIDGGPAHLQTAPNSLVDDPDFLALNKFINADGSEDLSRDLSRLSNQRDSLAKIFVTADQSDAVRLVWEWILADPDARAFIAGTPDPWGMTINKFFKGVSNYTQLDVPRADIPRLDPVCIDASVGFGGGATRPVCPLDAAPYVGNLDSGAALTSRGQPIGSQSWLKDFVSGFIKPAKAVPQLVGQRALIALTDTPSAQRRGLVSAELENSSGAFVAPTVESLTAALGQAVDTATPGVVRVPSSKVTGAAYPLTRLSYGVTNPGLLDQAARNDYAKFATFAAGDGQIQGTRPGQLPIGYAPLTASLRAQALTAAEAIRTAKAPTPRSSPAPTGTVPRAAVEVPSASRPSAATASRQPVSSPSASASGGIQGTGPSRGPAKPAATSSGGQTSGGLTAGGLPSAGPLPKPAKTQSPSASATTSAGPVAIQRVNALTPAVAVSALRWILPGLALLGFVAMASSRLMVRRGAPQDDGA